VLEHQFVVFRLESQEYAVVVEAVREIVEPMPVTPLPNTPVFVEGVISLRGEVIPVIDLRRRLQMPPAAPGAETRIMIAELPNQTVGVRVDGVAEVIKLDEERIVEPDPAFTVAGREYVRGLVQAGARLVVVLDLPRLLLDREAVSAV
jgi:purine-binding chemotaxis protein CheW